MTGGITHDGGGRGYGAAEAGGPRLHAGGPSVALWTLPDRLNRRCHITKWWPMRTIACSMSMPLARSLSYSSVLLTACAWSPKGLVCAAWPKTP